MRVSVRVSVCVFVLGEYFPRCTHPLVTTQRLFDNTDSRLFSIGTATRPIDQDHYSGVTMSWPEVDPVCGPGVYTLSKLILALSAPSNMNADILVEVRAHCAARVFCAAPFLVVDACRPLSRVCARTPCAALLRRPGDAVADRRANSVLYWPGVRLDALRLQDHRPCAR